MSCPPFKFALVDKMVETVMEIFFCKGNVCLHSLCCCHLSINFYERLERRRLDPGIIKTKHSKTFDECFAPSDCLLSHSPNIGAPKIVMSTYYSIDGYICYIRSFNQKQPSVLHYQSVRYNTPAWRMHFHVRIRHISRDSDNIEPFCNFGFSDPDSQRDILEHVTIPLRLRSSQVH